MSGYSIKGLTISPKGNLATIPNEPSTSWGLQGYIQMSMNVWYVASQTYLWCHTPHIQTFLTVLPCSAGGWGLTPEDSGAP